MGGTPAERADLMTPRGSPGTYVILESFTDKVKTIKVVREITGQGLGEAKATVEGAPKNIKEGIDKKTAEELKKKIEAEGGKVSVKPA